MTIRNYINITEAYADSRLDSLGDRKQTVLNALNHLLGCQTCTKGEKLASLREIEATAKRMADGIEQRLKVT